MGWISKLGNDEFGIFVHNFIRGEGVDTSQVKFLDEYPTSVQFKQSNPGNDPTIYYYRKYSAMSTMKPSDLEGDYIENAEILHVTGITPALSPTCRETVYSAIKIAKKANRTITFDPNIRLKLWSKNEAKEVLTDIPSYCDIVLPGLDEGQLMTGKESPEEIGLELLKGGSKVVVVKLGEQGAYFATEQESGYVPGVKVTNVVDTVGAGDGFAAGFISGLLRGWSYKKSLDLANQIGASALTVPGDIEGYPYWKQVDPNSTREEVKR